MSEPRSSPRLEAELPVRVLSETGPIAALGRELGSTGLFVEMAEPPAVNSIVSLELTLPDLGRTVTARCTVIYSNPRPSLAGSALRQGMGVKLQSLSHEDQQALDAHVQRARDKTTSVISTRRPERTPRREMRAKDPGEELVQDVLSSMEKKVRRPWWRRA